MTSSEQIATKAVSRICPIAAQARTRLLRSAYGPVRRVSCAFDQGVLVLRGRLTSFFHKQLAQEAVAGVDGVLRVRNEIEVVATSA